MLGEASKDRGGLLEHRAAGKCSFGLFRWLTFVQTGTEPRRGASKATPGNIGAVKVNVSTCAVGWKGFCFLRMEWSVFCRVGVWAGARLCVSFLRIGRRIFGE